MAIRKRLDWARVSIAAITFLAAPAWAARLDKAGEVKLGLRTYVNARIGTENTDHLFIDTEQAEATGGTETRSETFPYSSAGHLRQNRFFLELDFEHKLDRLVREGFGPLALVRHLPFRVTGLKYQLTFRAEADGIYDWGPSEYRTSSSYRPGNTITDPSVNLPDNPITGFRVDVGEARRKLRELGMHRERLFQAFLQGNVGDLFWRIGRQNLSWGESDGFRLLDNINPLDNSFGGFLISLDERRVPLDMLRLQYFLGSWGPIYDAFVEGYGAMDDRTSFVPGLVQGSPWAFPNLDKPSSLVLTRFESPARTLDDMRGGARIVFSAGRGTFSLAHYYTYADTPTVDVEVRNAFPTVAMDLVEPFGERDYLSLTTLAAQRMRISGATATFAAPYEWAQAIGLSGEPIFRLEFAYFAGEPRYRQEELDPFLFHALAPRPERETLNGKRTGDSVNLLVGMDINQFVRWLNPNQSIFVSTQFFYKHLRGAGAVEQADPRLQNVSTGEVLPVPEKIIDPGVPGLNLGVPIEPVFIRQPTDAFLQTLIVATSYRSGTIAPAFTLFYDWGGAWVYQPSVTFSYDPFRFAVDYSGLSAGRLKAGSGISLLRDRDSVQFRFEYVI